MLSLNEDQQLRNDTQYTIEVRGIGHGSAAMATIDHLVVNTIQNLDAGRWNELLLVIRVLSSLVSCFFFPLASNGR